jgi:hypothetical protein
MSEKGMDRHEVIWRQYELHVGLYKSYLDLVVKMNAGYYAIAGAIVSYFLAHRVDGMSRVGLLFPLVLGLGLILFFVYGAVMLKYTRRELIAIRDELGLLTIPEIKVLAILLWLSAAGFLVCSIGLVILWCNG